MSSFPVVQQAGRVSVPSLTGLMRVHSAVCMWKHLLVKAESWVQPWHHLQLHVPRPRVVYIVGVLRPPLDRRGGRACLYPFPPLLGLRWLSATAAAGRRRVGPDKQPDAVVMLGPQHLQQRR